MSQEQIRMISDDEVCKLDSNLTVGCDGVSCSSVFAVSDIHNLTGTHVDHITSAVTASNTSDNKTCNNDDDDNVNIIALSVIEWIIEQISVSGNGSHAIYSYTEKESCVENDPVFDKNRCVENKTEQGSLIRVLNKSFRVDEKDINSATENCVKENLMSALELSPVSKHTVEHVCSKQLQEKVKETVHFNSPIAIVHVFSEISQASSNNTDILSQSSSDDLLASQNTFSNTCMHDNDQTIDVTSLLKLDCEGKTNETEVELNLSAHRFCQPSCNEDSDVTAKGERNVNLNEVDSAVDSDLSNKNEEINSQDDFSAITIEHQQCEKENESVEDTYCESVSDTTEIQLACKVSNVRYPDYIKSSSASSENEDKKLASTETSMNESFVDTVPDQTLSEEINFALPKDDCTIIKIDELSVMTEKPWQVDSLKIFRNESTDFNKMQFDRSTGNEIFKKETLTIENETGNLELSLNYQTTQQHHDVKVNDQYTYTNESISNFQNYQFEKSAAKINLIMEPILDNDMDLPQATDIEIGEEDGRKYNGSDSLVFKEKIDCVNDCRKNFHAICEIKDDVKNDECTKSESDEIEPVFNAGKRELSIEPCECTDSKKHKAKHDSSATNQRKRRLTDKYMENFEKFRKIHNSIEIVKNSSGLHIPKMLKYLCSEKLAFMDEDVVWEYQNHNINSLKDKTNSDYSNKQIQQDEVKKAMPVNKSDLTIRNEDSDIVQDTENDDFNEHCLPTATDDAKILINNDNVAKEGHKTGHDDSETRCSAEEDFGLMNTADDAIVATSCKFITATEYLSQSSQNSGSTGFVYDTSGVIIDMCLSQSDTDDNVMSVSQESEPDKRGISENDEPLVIAEEKGHKTVTLYEMDESELNEEKVVVTSDIVYSYACDNTNVSGMKEANDEEEQIDTALLDMYVDKVVDQMIPNFDNDKLYACDADMYGDQDISICKPVEKSEKKDQQCFKWKYTPSCDSESDLPTPELPDEDHVVRITPLKTCGKPLRLGLSKRQPMRKSLHKIFRH